MNFQVVARKRDKITSMTWDELLELIKKDRAAEKYTGQGKSFCFCPAVGDVLYLPASFLYYTVGESTLFLRWGCLGSSNHQSLKMKQKQIIHENKTLRQSHVKNT